MIPIIEERREPSIGERFSKALGNISRAASTEIPEKLSALKHRREEDSALKKLGMDLEGIHDPELRRSIATQLIKQREDKNVEKMQSLRSLKSTIDEMRALSGATGVGILDQFNPTPEAFYNRSKLKTLSSDLLSFYKSLFPRGITQAEFQRLEKDYIPKAGDTDAAIRGKLDAFEDLINRKLVSEEPDEEEILERIEENPGLKKKVQKKVRFDAKNKEHQAKARQLYKQFKDIDRVRKELKREFEGVDVS